MSWDKEFYSTRTEVQDAELRRMSYVALACFWGCVVIALVAAFFSRSP